MQELLEGLSEAARQKGMKAMWAAAEGLARMAEAAAMTEANGREQAGAQAYAGAGMAARATADTEALEKANERDLLQRRLDELETTTRKAEQEAKQRCERLQQQLEEAVGAKDEAVRAKDEAVARNGLAEQEKLAAAGCARKDEALLQQKLEEGLHRQVAECKARLAQHEEIDNRLKRADARASAALAEAVSTLEQVSVTRVPPHTAPNRVVGTWSRSMPHVSTHMSACGRSSVSDGACSRSIPRTPRCVTS